jgi:hypothetical protein
MLEAISCLALCGYNKERSEHLSNSIANIIDTIRIEEISTYAKTQTRIVAKAYL